MATGLVDEPVMNTSARADPHTSHDKKSSFSLTNLNKEEKKMNDDDVCVWGGRGGGGGLAPEGKGGKGGRGGGWEGRRKEGKCK